MSQTGSRRGEKKAIQNTYDYNKNHVFKLNLLNQCVELAMLNSAKLKTTLPMVDANCSKQHSNFCLLHVKRAVMLCTK